MVINEATKPKPLDLRATLTKSDKIHYGNFLLYELLPGIFPGKEIEISNKSFYDFYSEDTLQNQNYIYINTTRTERQFTEYDIEYLLKYVATGNNAFLSCQSFSKKLQDTLLLNTENAYLEQVRLKTNPVKLAKTDTQMITSALSNKNYFFRSSYTVNYFSSYDTANTTILAYKTDSLNQTKQPILLKTKYGAGNFILNSTPLIFSNFNMVHNQHNFIAEALSNLPVENTVWDEYYKPYALEAAGTSPLRYILEQKALKWALYIMMMSFLIYTLFSGKRLQRVIPVIQSPRNISIEFANSLAMLYYHKKDHTGIANKRIEYFKAFLRNKYNVDVVEATSKDIDKLAKLTKLNANEIETLFTQLGDSVQENGISESELLNINQKIDEFYKNT